MKLSDYVMDFLVSKGVSDVFLLTGGGAMHLNDSLGKCENLEYTCFLHEQALAIACESYGQYTNAPGVGMVTSGPGSTNTVTAVAAAYFDSTPCVFISGQAKSADLKKDSGVRQMGSQEVDIVSIISPVTKFAVTVLDPEKIRYYLERAWYESTTGRKGPVWIDIPLDIQGATIEVDSLEGFNPEAKDIFESDLSDLSRIMELLNQAERPLILAGNGVKLADAQQELLKFIETNQIPVLTTWKSLDLLDYEHPLNFGNPGIMGSRFANFIVQSSDLLIVIGSRLEPSVTAFDAANFGSNATKVMIDVDEAEIRKVKGIDLPVIADAKDFLQGLLSRQSEIESADRSEWLSYCRRVKGDYPVVLDEYREQTDAVNLYVFTDVLCNHLSSDEIITPESSGAAGEITYQAFRLKKGQKIKNAAGLGSMGFGLPYSIGACIANGRKRTVLINGDGAFQMNIQELETVRRLKLPVKMFILENQGYASIRTTQTKMFDGFFVGSGPNSGLSMPDLDKQAATYGFRYEEVRTNAELDEVISRTLAGEDTVICSVKVTELQVTAPKVQAMKLPDGGMVSKPIEDMWPYLPAEEIKKNVVK